MITLSNVSKIYPGTTAVDDLSFTVEDREFSVLIGPSGCGKSTTLRMINRLIPATAGTIAIDGADVTRYRPEDLRRRIGYAIQNVGLFPHMTVAQNIEVVPSLLGWDRRRRDERVGELLALFGLDPAEYRDKHPRQLSGGEAQRVGVARALAADPSILLMDEPFGALDPITRESLQTEFARIQRELRKTIVFVTHDIDEAVRLASRIVILKDGRLVQHDVPEQILTAPASRFVLDFIGADRALRRLTRLPVSAHVRSAPSVTVGQSLEDARLELAGRRRVWVVDERRTVVGWLEGVAVSGLHGKVADTMTSSDWRTFGVSDDATLREALSRMIQQGVGGAPVVDAEGRLLGEIAVDAILEA